MDVDALAEAHGRDWDRLQTLAAPGRLEGRASDELIARYQAAATDLSAVSSTVGDSAVGDRLSLAISRARLRFTGAGRNPLRELGDFFGARLPAALYRIRWLTLVIAVVSLGSSVAYGAWMLQDPAILGSVVSQMGGEAAARRYADRQFVAYYSNYSEGVFATQVWTNNAFLAMRLIALGWTGVWVPASLLGFFQQLGFSGGILVHFGRPDALLFLVPHGLLELYSVFLAAAAGLSLFWVLVVPGHRTRMQALRENGRSFVAVVVAVTITLLLSGLIEGAVTRQAWPWPIKISIGVLAIGSVLVYQWVLGRRAWRAGQTGDVGEFDAGARQIVDG